MQQAEEVMAEDENRRRHEALSRLKAAVAATEADRADLDYEAPKVEANLDPYRDDLAEAIRPTKCPGLPPRPGQAAPQVDDDPSGGRTASGHHPPRHDQPTAAGAGLGAADRPLCVLLLWAWRGSAATG